MIDSELESKIWNLDFAVEKSIRYHQRRRGHYDFYHKVLMFAAIIGGSAAFAELSINFAAFAAICSAVNLVYGLSQKARDHEILFRRFSELAILIRTTKPVTEDLYLGWLQKRINIETEEPPIYEALEADCYNEVCRAWGKKANLIPISWYYRISMNWCRHAQASF